MDSINPSSFRLNPHYDMVRENIQKLKQEIKDDKKLDNRTNSEIKQSHQERITRTEGHSIDWKL